MILMRGFQPKLLGDRGATGKLNFILVKNDALGFELQIIS